MGGGTSVAHTIYTPAAPWPCRSMTAPTTTSPDGIIPSLQRRWTTGGAGCTLCRCGRVGGQAGGGGRRVWGLTNEARVGCNQSAVHSCFRARQGQLVIRSVQPSHPPAGAHRCRVRGGGGSGRQAGGPLLRDRVHPGQGGLLCGLPPVWQDPAVCQQQGGVRGRREQGCGLGGGRCWCGGRRWAGRCGTPM